MSDTWRVLAAGDRFVLPRLFAEAVRGEVAAVEVRELELPWPDVPFGDVGDVSEASGDEGGLIAALEGRQAIVTQVAPITERILDASPELRFIGVSRGGPVNIHLEAARARGVTVVNAPGRNGIATGEMTVGLILAVTRRIGQSHGALLRHEWRGDFYRFDETGPEMDGSTVGLVGFGAVGAVVARALVAMGARVLVYDPYIEAGRLAELGVERVDDPDDLFRRSLLVSLHARLTPETERIVDARRLALMAPGSYLVNSARGPLMDYDAVVAAVDSGQLAGLALDVFPTEPAEFDHGVFRLLAEGRNVVVTPHIAGASQDVARRAARIVAEELGRFVRDEPLRHRLVP